MSDAEYVPSTSQEAVAGATGRTWDAWFRALDDAGAIDMDHKAIVAWLRDEAGLESGWWRQSVTVEYEKARGKRAAVGETADAGFQVGAQRTIRVAPERAWELVTTRPGRDAWLGRSDDFVLGEGDAYTTDEGVTGEVRVVRPGTRLRLTWHPSGWDRPSTVQVTLTPKGDRCTIGLHHERLPDLDARQSMRDRWRAALDRLQERAEGA